ncbi:MAG TPA: hypothetical protein VM308_02610 [Sphingomicrobium sp.]|nr:hypothetical protein [Sphingomicrobium sp.]
MDDAYTPRPVSRWYMAGAVLSLALMTFAVAASAMRLATDPSTLPLDERAQVQAEPMWLVVLFALAAVAGAAGGLMLVLRRRAAEPLLLVALAGAALWFVGLFVSPLRDLLATGQIAGAAALVAVAWTIFWFARHSRQRGWLR